MQCTRTDNKTGAGDGNRTHVSSLGSSRTTIVRHPREEDMILAKALTKGKRLPTRHLGQFTHALRNICFLDLGRFL